MEKVRAFIAIDFPDEVVKEIARVQEVFGNKQFTGKMTELENLHLTLKFLGEIEAEKVEEVRSALREIKFGKFEARLAEAGTFNHRGKPSIVWIKVGGEGIFDLQSAVDLAVEKCGFKKEKRFMSHLTIARVKYVKDKKDFVGYVKRLGVRDVKFNVGGFKLMRSELQPMGPVYTVVEEFELKEK
ncbi:MAG: RNA 2',3'-cyclic phosphodiesterase [Nanoarchaeota archaeon]|nr:RNA 2',3'-cyclic phosphodiesterase [Nanoarchaeota archaeon]MBU0977753.1 RNA 2',3'-cyclic phosphodiesterase [Nanoarchaeota archaeon]